MAEVKYTPKELEEIKHGNLSIIAFAFGGAVAGVLCLIVSPVLIILCSLILMALAAGWQIAIETARDE